MAPKTMTAIPIRPNAVTATALVVCSASPIRTGFQLYTRPAVVGPRDAGIESCDEQQEP